jgi:YD repeat-containing protein
MQVVGQSQITYGFDNANRLTSISQGSAVGFSYDSANRRSCLTLPNGVVATYGYDSDSRITSLTYGTNGTCSSSPPPSNLGNLTYSYDANGHRTATAGTLQQ